MAEEKNKKKFEEEFRESEQKSPDDFDKDNETETSDFKKSEQKSPDDFDERMDDGKEDLYDDLKQAEDMSPDDYDDENEAEGDIMKEAEDKSPDDFDENTDSTTGKKAPKNKKSSGKGADNIRIRELEDNFQNLNDKYLRLYSEFDNFRKRTLKEKADLSKTASQYVVEDLLTVLDDFERAIKAHHEAKNVKGSIEGFILIYNKLKNILKTKGLEEMDSNGKEFNTDYHDAITQIPAPSKDLKGKVVDVIEKGYLLNGKVIRFAKVVVGN